jgi:hypothetical protein
MAEETFVFQIRQACEETFFNLFMRALGLENELSPRPVDLVLYYYRLQIFTKPPVIFKI